jgi:hypothetical protein
LQQKDFAIQAGVGDKKIRIRRNHETYDIKFCSPDYLQEYFSPAVVCGYTDLRPKRMKAEKKEEIGILQYDGVAISSVYRKQHKTRSIRGYLSVGGDNFVAIESHRFLLWLLPILLALILLLVFSFCVLIPYGTSLTVSATYDSVLLLTDNTATELPYELRANPQSASSMAAVTSGSTILTVAAGDPDAVTTSKVAARLTQAADYAGAYTNLVEFDVSVS